MIMVIALAVMDDGDKAGDIGENRNEEVRAHLPTDSYANIRRHLRTRIHASTHTHMFAPLICKQARALIPRLQAIKSVSPGPSPI